VDGAFRKCVAGWSAWIWANQNGCVVATFKNWSGDRARNATFKGFGTKAAAAAPAPTWPQAHTVVRGDNLSKIAQAAYGKQDWPKVYAANKGKIEDANLIFPGQEFTLPAPQIEIEIENLAVWRKQSIWDARGNVGLRDIMLPKTEGPTGLACWRVVSHCALRLPQNMLLNRTTLATLGQNLY